MSGRSKHEDGKSFPVNGAADHKNIREERTTALP